MGFVTSWCHEKFRKTQTSTKRRLKHWKSIENNLKHINTATHHYALRTGPWRPAWMTQYDAVFHDHWRGTFGYTPIGCLKAIICYFVYDVTNEIVFFRVWFEISSSRGREASSRPCGRQNLIRLPGSWVVRHYLLDTKFRCLASTILGRVQAISDSAEDL